MIRSEVPAVPKSQKMEGELARPLLVVALEERGEFFDDPSFTSYHVYDPGLPVKGLVQIFKGPENDQRLRPLTPLYDGWALSRVHLDREKDPEGESKWAWYYYPKGIIGEEVKDQFWIRESMGEWLFGEKKLGQSLEEGVHLMRYQPKVGKMEQTKFLFWHTEWISSTEVLGVVGIEEGERVVLFDIHRFEYRDLGPPPPSFNSEHSGFFPRRMWLAGKSGVDGVYSSSWKENGFSLHFLPNGEKWMEVISGVKVGKTFGGVLPSLPVEYLGGGNFAISKTIVDTVPVPDEWPEDEKKFGAAKGVTMLIEGASGKVLKVSKPFVYHHNPPLKIPKDWWEDGFKAKVPFGVENSGEVATLFRWDEELGGLNFANGSMLPLSKEEGYRVSDAGRYAVVYRKWTGRKKDGKAGQELRMLDGRGGGIQEIKIESDFDEVLTEVYWIEAASSSVK